MGRELAEGKVHGLEQQVALAKGFVEDMRTRYLELEDHTHTLDAEAEDFARQVWACLCVHAILVLVIVPRLPIWQGRFSLVLLAEGQRSACCAVVMPN